MSEDTATGTYTFTSKDMNPITVSPAEPTVTTTPADTEAQRIVNDPVTVHAFGRTYQISKFTMGPLIRAAHHIAPLGYLLRSAIEAQERKDVTDLLVSALSLGGEPALGLISVATSEPVEWLELQDPLEGAEILMTTIERNADYFFDPKSLAKMAALRVRLESVIQKHGGSISTTSSSTTTAR